MPTRLSLFSPSLSFAVTHTESTAVPHLHLGTTPCSAPAKPKTPYGEMLQYYLRMEPQLFRAAVDQQLVRMKEEKDAKDAAAAAAAASADESGDEAGKQQRSKSELVLYQRMEEVRAMEVRATLEDLMYVSILEKFVLLQVEMLPRLDGE